MPKMICPNCGLKVNIIAGFRLGEVICDKCNEYLGEVVASAVEEDGVLTPRRLFVVVIDDGDEVLVQKEKAN